LDIPLSSYDQKAKWASYTSLNYNKKAVLPQGNRAMPHVFFSVEVANNIHYKYKTSQASKAATLQSSKHAD